MNFNQSPLSLKEVLQGRARMYRHIRAFFQEKGVLEVETPIFSRAGNTDPSIQSLSANFRASNSESELLRYGQTSPEFAMKRLLTNGIGSIYQICKVFRIGEIGRLHNPEFTMLEWYRPALDYLALMDEIEELLKFLNVASTCQRITYATLFKRFLDLDIMACSVAELKVSAAKNGIDVIGMDDNYNDWCDLLLTHVIEPELSKMGSVFVYDYPASQAALANIRLGEHNVAERFELYVDGVELANGYQELTDEAEYKTRFLAENKLRLKNDMAQMPIDDALLTALRQGLPDCSGVALGLDRLLMRYLNVRKINDVLSFNFSEA